MRFLLVFTAIMFQMFLAKVSSAQNYDDCRVSCNWDKGARDVESPSPYEFSDSSRRRDSVCIRVTTLTPYAS